MDQIREAEDHDRADMERRLRLVGELLGRWKADLITIRTFECGNWNQASYVIALVECIKQLERALKGVG